MIFISKVGLHLIPQHPQTDPRWQCHISYSSILFWIAIPNQGWDPQSCPLAIQCLVFMTQVVFGWCCPSCDDAGPIAADPRRIHPAWLEKSKSYKSSSMQIENLQLDVERRGYSMFTSVRRRVKCGLVSKGIYLTPSISVRCLSNRHTNLPHFLSITMQGTDTPTTPTAMVAYVFTGSSNEIHGC